MKLQIIDTGYFYADGGAMFGAIPKAAWKRRYPCNDDNECVLAMRTLLVETDDGRLILIDNGAGSKHLEQLSYYKFFDRADLGEQLEQSGYTPAQVTDVVLTHLHFDHCGYTTALDEAQQLSLAFPDAVHWVSRAQWDACLHPSPLERDSFFADNILPVAEAGRLRLIEEDTRIHPLVSLRLYDGHTPGQLVAYIETEERTVVFAGDVIPLAPSVSLEWISAYDTFPLTSYAEKKRMLEEAARSGQAIVFCHDAYTRCATIRKINDFYKPDPLSCF